MALDYTNFLNCKNQLQKIYNYKAKEEREIIYGVQIQFDVIATKSLFMETETNVSLTERQSDTESVRVTMRKSTGISNSIPNTIQVVLINKAANQIYLEIVKIQNSTADISFKYSTSLNSISKLQYKSCISQDETGAEVEVNECFIKAEKDFNIIFHNTVNLKEFMWCLIHLIEYGKLETNVAVKGVNYKDLEDFAEKNKLKDINPIFANIKKKERYEIEVTDTELENLSSTLKNLNIDSLISYDLEHLNSKIEQFSIERKELFLKELQGEFRANVNDYLSQLTTIENEVHQMLQTTESDIADLNSLNAGIQKIEDKNRRIELRNENKKKLKEYMNKILEQLTISPSKKQTLLRSQYQATSELIIIREVLENFVTFYKNRQKQDINMFIIKEGQEQIKQIVTSLITNFYATSYEYIKSKCFDEAYLYKGMPSYKNQNLKKYILANMEVLKAKRTSLLNYILDRKFVIQKLNILFDQQEDLNQIDAFKSCRTNIAKGMRDNFANEFNKTVEMWELFFDSNLLDDKKFDLYLDRDTFMTYDAFTQLYTEPLYEASKFFSTIILNAFFTCDLCVEHLMTLFNESPMFNIEKGSQLCLECEQIVSMKVYDMMTKNFEASREKSILLAIIIYSILSAVQEKLSKNIIGDYVQLSVRDIFEVRKVEEDVTVNLTQYDQVMNDDDLYDLEEIGIYKISCQETKNFIATNMKHLKGHIITFLSEQKDIISKYTVETRRVGIIPIVKKTINFLKLLLAITNGVKNEFLYEIFEEFKIKLKTQIEKIAVSDKKYTNIVLAENYHFIVRFFKSVVDSGLNIDNPKFALFENDFMQLYNQFKEYYVIEVFEYQFKEFAEFFNSFKTQYKINKSQIKVQSGFTSQIFEKKVALLFKDFNKEIDIMSKRVLKHFCKEEGLSPVMWKEEVDYISNVLNDINEFSKTCYGKPIENKVYLDAIRSFNFKAIYTKNK